MSDSISNKGMIYPGAMLAVAVIIGAWLLNSAIIGFKKYDNTIKVTGYAEASIKADLAVWNVKVQGKGATMKEGYDKLQADFPKVVEKLESMGFEKRSMTISAITTTPIYKYSETGNTLTGYVLDRAVRIEHRDVNKVADAAIRITELFSQNVDLVPEPPEYLVSNIDKWKMNMLAEAMSNAKKRAAELAKNSGSEVGNLKTANQGVFQITQPNSTEVADWGMYDVTTIDKTIKSVVTVEYTVK